MGNQLVGAARERKRIMSFGDDDLGRRQREHMARVNQNWTDRTQVVVTQPCAHNSCSQCVGTGVKLDGSMCIHMTQRSIYGATHDQFNHHGGMVKR